MLGPRIARREESHNGARRVSITRYHVDVEEMEGQDGERFKVYRRVAVVKSERRRPYTVPLRTLRRPSMAGLHSVQQVRLFPNLALRDVANPTFAARATQHSCAPVPSPTSSDESCPPFPTPLHSLHLPCHL